MTTMRKFGTVVAISFAAMTFTQANAQAGYAGYSSCMQDYITKYFQLGGGYGASSLGEQSEVLKSAHRKCGRYL